MVFRTLADTSEADALREPPHVSHESWTRCGGSLVIASLQQARENISREQARNVMAM
jgi:hypothetical protein